MHTVHAPCASEKCGAQSSFPVFVGKARTFSLNPGRNSHYKYQPSSFRTGAVHEEGNSKASEEFLSFS